MMNPHIAKWFEQHAADVTRLSDDMWHHPEVAFEEYYACAQTAAFMEKHGFEVKAYDASHQGREPNCLVATYGSGKPVVGILGELDALPGLGQEAVPTKALLDTHGHGCGHNLLGAGAAAAAAGMAAAMAAEGLAGTVIYYGCPAEETVEGKVYMAKDGLFDNLDACLSWHPFGGSPRVAEISMQANTNMDFMFHGITSHAAGDPWHGRSALDAAELMSMGVQYLREHVTDDVRIHHAYLSAGLKPNIVPDYAAVNYYIRAASRDVDKEVVERVKDIARGAALMTGTTVDWKLNTAVYDTLVLHSFNRFLHASASKVPEIDYTPEEYDFANTMYEAHVGAPFKGDDILPAGLEPLTGTITNVGGSTDVSDVSHIVPTAQIFGPGAVGGLPGHHWTITAPSGMSIGHKAELYVGRCLAQCGVDLLKQPEALKAFWDEFKEARKDMGPYENPLK